MEYYKLVAEYYAQNKGPYLLGSTITYADFAVYQSWDNDTRIGTLPVSRTPFETWCGSREAGAGDVLIFNIVLPVVDPRRDHQPRQSNGAAPQHCCVYQGERAQGLKRNRRGAGISCREGLEL